MNKLKVVVLFSFLIVCATSCEKGLVPNSEVNSGQIRYVNENWYNQNKGNKGLSETSANGGPKRLLVWQKDTHIQLDDDLACLPTPDGDCYDDVVVTPGSPQNVEYNIFLQYDGNENIEGYFATENWQVLLPMLEQSTVNLILDNELDCIHNYNENSDIAYFVFVDSSNHNKVEFAIPLAF